MNLILNQIFILFLFTVPPMLRSPESRQDSDERDNNQSQSGSLRDRMLSKDWGSYKSYKVKSNANYQNFLNE